MIFAQRRRGSGRDTGGGTKRAPSEGVARRQGLRVTMDGKLHKVSDACARLGLASNAIYVCRAFLSFCWQFDNLYIDMNGIIHPCSHPEDKPPPESEAEMYKNIMDYVDRC